MADPVGTENAFNIVVIGGMNPKIHIPPWYRHVGLINEEEMNHALEKPVVAINPEGMVFFVHLSDITIACREFRWEIRTTDLSKISRTKEIASKVFDEYLIHTPISQLGFNFIFTQSTSKKNSSYTLAKSVSSMPLGLPSDALLSGEFILTQLDSGRRIQTGVTPLNDNKIQIAINFEYAFEPPLENPNKIINFRLGDIIEKRHTPDMGEATTIRDRITQSFNQSRE